MCCAQLLHQRRQMLERRQLYRVRLSQHLHILVEHLAGLGDIGRGFRHCSSHCPGRCGKL